jgi:hypothetical protein
MIPPEVDYLIMKSIYLQGTLLLSAALCCGTCDENG